VIAVQNFIYVFDVDARDTLLSMKYELLKSDDDKKIYVFVNKDRRDFSCAKTGYVLSDTLTF